MTTISIKRERINAEELHDRLRKSKTAAPSTAKQARFTVLPRAFVSAPGRYRLSIYETGILAALIAGARQRDYADRKAIADGAKQRAFNRRIRQDRNMKAAQLDSKNAWRASMMKQQMEFDPPDRLSFVAYPTTLLDMAGLSTDTRALDKLDDALARLREPLIDGLPSPLLKAVRLKSGRYRYVVSGGWIVRPHRRVNLPLPTKSLNATNLYLFLRTQLGTRTVELKDACKAIGVASRKAFEQRRIIGRAFDLANEAYMEQGVEVPTPRMPVAWRLEWIRGDRVRFTPAYHTDDG
jgi:hypothetical protein